MLRNSSTIIDYYRCLQLDLRMKPEEETKIREEEELRHKVRKELAEKNFTFWQFLNSGFVLWILSSIVVTGFVSGFSYWQQTTTSRSNAARRVSEFDSELRNRLRFFSQRIKTLGNEMEMERLRAVTTELPSGWYKEVKQVWFDTQQPEFSPSPEFRLMPIDQLLSSLSESITASGETNGDLAKAIDDAKKDWKEISKDCYEGYNAFRPENLKVDGYYTTVAGVIDRTKDRLTTGPLKKWASIASNSP